MQPGHYDAAINGEEELFKPSLCLGNPSPPLSDGWAPLRGAAD